MPTTSEHSLPNFLAIREAVMAAPPHPAGFPLAALHDADNLKALRQAPHFQQFLAELRSEAAQSVTTPIPPLPFSLFHLFETTGDRTEYERPYLDRRRRLLALTLETVIEESDAYLPALTDLIWEVCNEYTWALPAHLPVGITAVQTYRLPPEQIIDLFSAHTATVLNYESQPDGVSFTLDLTCAYPEAAALDSFIRSFTWSVDAAARFAVLALVDVLQFQKETAVFEECFISLKPPTLAEGIATWRGERGAITLHFADDQFEPTVDTIATQTHVEKPITVYRLRLRVRQTAVNQEAVFVFACHL